MDSDAPKFIRPMLVGDHDYFKPESYFSRNDLRRRRVFLSGSSTRVVGVSKEKSRYPVVNVNWYDAIDFCDWLSQKIGRKIALPSEREWEKAARGSDGHIYPWGNNAPTKDRANYGAGGIFQVFSNRTSMVGQYSPKGDSPYGCADMAGNVWEWTCSLWGKSEDSPEFRYPYQMGQGWEDLKANHDIRRVVRGGLWDSYARWIRSAYRRGFQPNGRSADCGFRVVARS